MLTGLLTVLKILGIAILAILVLILLILILILFVPFRYKLDGTIPETDLDQGISTETIMGSASFSWLLHFVSGGIKYPEEKEFTVRIMGIKLPIGKNSDKEDKEKKEEKETKDKDKKKKKDKKNRSDKKKDKPEEVENKKTSDTDGSDDNKTDPETESKDLEDNGSLNLDTGKDASDTNSDLEDKDLASDSDTNTRTEKENKALIEIVQDIVDKIESILKTPQNVLEKMQYTISRVCGKIGMIKNTLENDIFKRAFKLVKDKLIRIIKMILPDKSKVDLMLGLGDPADTAQAMAAFGALYPVLYKSVSFRPDFDRKVIYADAHFKGHITLFTILYCVCVCYFNKDVKKVIRRFKKIMNS